ncbi:hypothetical protein TanjilG_01652 [Lupinus angustifolius]|uniref:Mei2-like C-terminal RNA recognition motif domain-containing protein n=1 Tax=Lupinus angustifolius TaxID=3871 RepID=A0A1J7GV91_LUPAN|nr:hypothetical protein TanjilG_01652 [Lupinus angustifolius]
MATRPLNPNAQPFYPPNTLHNQHVSAESTNQNITRSGRNRAKYEWRMKGTRPTTSKGKLPYNDGCATRGNVIPFPTTIEKSSITTVMIRNIPNQFTFCDLLKILDEHCFELNKNAENVAAYSKFDFLYLPMDFRKHAIEKKLSNLGYAFVNFTSPSAAFKFYMRFNGFVWNVTTNRKTCEINAAQYQGVEALIRKFREKVFRCKRSDFLPFVFWEHRDGFNSQVVGTTVGKHIWGLPRRT